MIEMECIMRTNTVQINGTIVSDITFDHSVYDKNFYQVMVEVRRMSGFPDILPITLPERLLADENIVDFSNVKITGEIRTYSRSDPAMTVFAEKIEAAEDDDGEVNEVYLQGILYQKPIFRKTPLGRSITNILLEVNMNYNKSAYVPCIFWGHNAKQISVGDIGNFIRLNGRLQSRDYMKQLGELQIKKTAYEVSVEKYIIG